MSNEICTSFTCLFSIIFQASSKNRGYKQDIDQKVCSPYYMTMMCVQILGREHLQILRNFERGDLKWEGLSFIVNV